MDTREVDVTLGDLDDVEGVLDVQGRLQTPSRQTRRDYLLWKYGANPDRSNSHIVIARSENQVVGMRGYMGQRWTVGSDRTVSIPLAGDTVVVREHEGRGLLQLMNRVAAAECRRRGNPFMMNIGAGPAVYLQSRRSGWREIEPMRIPAKLNADSEEAERRFWASRTLVGA